MAKSFKIKLIKGLRGCSDSQRKTVEALGLTRINSEVAIADNPANRGQVRKIQHLVTVTIQK